MKTRSALLLLFISAGIVLPAAAQTRSLFLVLRADADIQAEARLLETLGVRIRQRVPPQILMGEFSGNLSLSAVKIEDRYTGPIPLSRLEPLGPLAVAAGTQWNRQVLKDSRAAGTFSATRSLVAKNSLVSPANLAGTSDRFSIDRFSINVSFEPLDGASYYEIEASLAPDFGGVSVRTRTSKSIVVLPISGPHYLRVRGVDHVEAEHQVSEDVFGAWSQTVLIPGVLPPGTLPAEALVLTSPVNNFESEGFTVILEWVAGPKSKSRIQLSRTESFDNILADEVVQGGAYDCPGPILHVGETIYWRVKRWGSEGSPWSSHRQFKVGPPSSHAVDMFVNPESPQ